jgi:hypothetical protein
MCLLVYHGSQEVMLKRIWRVRWYRYDTLVACMREKDLSCKDGLHQDSRGKHTRDKSQDHPPLDSTDIINKHCFYVFSCRFTKIYAGFNLKIRLPLIQIYNFINSGGKGPLQNEHGADRGLYF